jgi:hypothetical protein
VSGIAPEENRTKKCPLLSCSGFHDFPITSIVSLLVSIRMISCRLYGRLSIDAIGYVDLFVLMYKDSMINTRGIAIH